MKAVVADPVGGPENLKYVDLPIPEPGPGEVLVKVEAIGVNFIDTYFRSGFYKAPESPVKLGNEAAGTVVKTGQGANWQAGNASLMPWLADPMLNMRSFPNSF